MGLIGGMARTAVVAGTATAVSNRVSRRQANRWAEKDQQAQDAADARPTGSSRRTNSSKPTRRPLRNSLPRRRRTTCLPSFRSLESSRQPVS